MSDDIGFFITKTEPLILIISGLSGAGKDAVLGKVDLRPEVSLRFVVTCNTRKPREGEVDGKDYHFVSKERFFEMVEHGEMLEHSKVYDDYKGVPRFEVEEAFMEGKDLVMRLDFQGMQKVKKVFPNAVSIFIIPPDSKTWLERLRHRGTDSEESLKLRIETAISELACVPDFDYVVVNDDLETAADEVVRIVQAEHCKTSRRKIKIQA